MADFYYGGIFIAIYGLEMVVSCCSEVDGLEMVVLCWPETDGLEMVVLCYSDIDGLEMAKFVNGHICW